LRASNVKFGIPGTVGTASSPPLGFENKRADAQIASII
jgi:hypothetical protein